MIELHGLHVVLSFVGFCALFTFCGLTLAKVWLVPALAFELPDLYARWRQMLDECLVLLAVAGVMLLLVRTAEMDNGTLTTVLADLPAVLTQTHFGLIWTLHLLTLFWLWACCYTLLSSALSRIWGICMVCGTLILAFTYSASSHASDDGDFTLLELNDWAHIVATSVWGGSIFVSALLLFPLLQGKHALISTVAIRLSTLAGTALACVLATGVNNSILQVRDLDVFRAGNYGRLLGIKLAVVLLMIAIGAFNRFFVVSHIKSNTAGDSSSAAKPLRLLYHTLGVDVAFVLLAIIMASALVQNETN